MARRVLPAASLAVVAVAAVLALAPLLAARAVPWPLVGVGLLVVACHAAVVGGAAEQQTGGES